MENPFLRPTSGTGIITCAGGGYQTLESSLAGNFAAHRLRPIY
jgi:hypothetical protein